MRAVDSTGHSAPAEFDVDVRVFSLSVIKKTAHRLAKLGSFQIDVVDDSRVRVRATNTREDIEAKFREILVEQDWRETVAQKTEPLRNLIVAQAFSPFSLIVPEADTADYHDDVLCIAIADRAK